MADEKPAPPKAPAPVVAKVAPKPKQSIVEIRFNEGMRDVEVKIVKDEGTMTPRKIEHSTFVLMKVFRQHLGQMQAVEARKARAAEAASTDVTK